MLRRKDKLGRIDSPLYRYWQALYLSLYSSKLYIDVVKRWRGFGMKYLIFFLLIFTVPLAVKSIVKMNNEIKYNLLEPVYLIPKFKVLNGHVQFNGNMPYFIKNSEGKISVIIDTTGVINKINTDYPDLLLLINSTKMYFRFPKLGFLKNDPKNADIYNKQEIEIQDLSNITEEEFVGEDFIKESGFFKLKNFLLVLVYPFIVSSLFGMLITAILALAIMGQVAAYAIFNYKITYKQSSRIAVIATSIGVGIYLNLKVFDISSPRLTFLCIVIAFMYFCYGVLSVKRDSKHLVHY